MAAPPPTNGRLSAHDSASLPSSSSSRPPTKLRSFLTTTMCLLSLLVVVLGLAERNTLWLWVGFICTLVSGVFFQLLINRRRAAENAESRKHRGHDVS